MPTTGFWKTCSGCGAAGRVIAGACGRCHLHDQLQQSLPDPSTGHIHTELDVLRQTLADARRPETVLKLLRRNTVRTLLTELAAGQRPLTHTALDELPASKTLAHLRSVLAATG